MTCAHGISTMNLCMACEEVKPARVLGRVASYRGNVVTLIDEKDAIMFRPGMMVGASCSPGGRNPRVGVTQVMSRDLSAGTVTLFRSHDIYCLSTNDYLVDHTLESARSLLGDDPPKVDWTQLPWDELRELAEVMTDPRGSAWRSLPLSAHKQSLGRHLAAGMLDEPDPDTGKSSWLYVAARALMARAAQKKESK